MKKTRYAFVLLAFAFLGLFGGITSAEKIKTVYLSPIDVRVDVQDSILKATTWGKSLTSDQIANIQKINFQVIDNYEAEVFSEETPWTKDFIIASASGDDQVLIPFVHDFSKNDLSGVYELRVVLQDQRGKTIARGSREFTMTQEEPVTKIANLELKTGDHGSVNFLAFYEGRGTQTVQPEITVRVQPQIDVFEHVAGGTLVFSQKGNIQNIPSNQKTAINMLFDIPDIPETYVVEARLLDENGNPITGTLSQRLLVDGDFGEIDFFDATPKKFLEAGETVHIAIAGMARRNNNPLTVKVMLDQIYRGEVQGTLSQEKQLMILDQPDFSENFSFVIPDPGASQFVAKVQLLRQGYLIEEKEFHTAEYLKYDTTAYKLYYGIMSDYLYLYVLGFVIVVGLIIWLVKSHKSSTMTGLFLAICILGMWGNVQAAWINQWTYPQDGWVYNPQDTTGFAKIRFQGSVVDDGTGIGLFSTWGAMPDSTVVDFYPASGGASLATVNANPPASAFNGTDYEFEFDIPVSLLDEDYTPQITFSKSGQEDVETSWAGSITLDTIPPTLGFSYNPSSFTNQSVTVTIDCESDRSGCYPTDPINSFAVQGNFCSDSGKCDVSAPRGFSVCDKVGNCSVSGNNELTIDFYDPEAPTLDGFQLLRDSVPQETKMEANDTFDTAVQNPVDPNTTEQSLDTDACGPAIAENDIYLSGTECATRLRPCAISAVEHGSYDQSAGETIEGDCTFIDLPVDTCNPLFFPLCVPFIVE